MSANRNRSGLRSMLSAARRRMLSTFYRRTIPLGDHGPVVTFAFDDYPRTAYTVAGRILESFGARGTYYVAPGLMGTCNGLGEICTAEDIEVLLEAGHEVGSQTSQHSSPRKVSLERYTQDVEQGIVEMERLTGRPARNFSYPYGHVTLGTKRKLEPLVSSSRSVLPGINGPEIDLNLLLANRLYGDISEAPSVHRLVEQNVSQRGWLIFYTHDVQPSASEYGCTPELFEYAVKAVAESGSRILTAEQLLKELEEHSSPRKDYGKGTSARAGRR